MQWQWHPVFYQFSCLPIRTLIRPQKLTHPGQSCRSSPGIEYARRCPWLRPFETAALLATRPAIRSSLSHGQIALPQNIFLIGQNLAMAEVFFVIAC